MKIVDLDFFINKLPNLHEVNNCDPKYVGMIQENEDICLRVIFGECMYEDLLEQLVFNPTTVKYELKVDANIKWHYLLYGRKYNKSEVENYTSNYYFGHYKNGCGCGCNSATCDDFYWKGLVEVFESIGMIRNKDNYTMEQALIQSKTSLIADFIMWKYFIYSQTYTSGVGEIVVDVKNADNVNNIHRGIKSYNNFVSKCIRCTDRGSVGLYAYVQHFKDEFPNWDGACLQYKQLI